MNSSNRTKDSQKGLTSIVPRHAGETTNSKSQFLAVFKPLVEVRLLSKVKVSTLGFGAILAVAAMLRLYHLGADSIADDEAYHAVTAAAWADSGTPMPPSGIPYTRGLPLIYLEMLSLRYIPFDFEAALRLPVALLGIFNTFMFFVLGKRYGGNGLGLFAALIFAVSPWSVSFGRDLRMYELLLSCSMLCLYQYEKFVALPTFRRLLLLSGVLMLGVSSHRLGLLLTLLPLSGILLHLDSRRVSGGLFLASCLQLAFALAFPAILRLVWQPEPGADIVAGQGVTFAGLSLQAQRTAWMHGRTVWIAGSLALFAALAYYVRCHPTFAIHTPAIWISLILVTGVAGLLLVSALAVLGYLAVSGLADERGEVVLRRRIHAAISMAAVLSFWTCIAMFAASNQQAFGFGTVFDELKPTLRFPDINHAVVRPLLAQPPIALLFQFGAGVCVLLCLRALIRPPLLACDRSFVARVLWLLSALVVIGSFIGLYRSDRYAYFLFPPALLSILQATQAYFATTPRWVRRCAVTVGLCGILFLELGASAEQVLLAGGRSADTGITAYLPDYGARARPGERIDYRAASQFLRSKMGPNDLLLVDAAHQFQAYLPRIDGHLTPNLREYSQGTYHYFTGSKYLRTARELAEFVESQRLPPDAQVWIAIARSQSAWALTLKPALVVHECLRQGPLSIYAATADEMLAKLNVSR